MEVDADAGGSAENAPPAAASPTATAGAAAAFAPAARVAAAAPPAGEARVEEAAKTTAPATADEERTAETTGEDRVVSGIQGVPILRQTECLFLW